MSCCNTSGFLTPDQIMLIAQNNKAIYEEICKIQQAILDFIACQGATSNTLYVSGDTPMTFYSTITNLILSAGGTGYNNFNASLEINHSTGTGAIAELVIENGVIESVNILNSGTGYDTIDPVTYVIDHPYGQNANIEFVVSAGGINSATVINGGTGYNELYPTLAIVGAPGTGATGTFSVNPTTFAIEHLQLTSGGINYPANTVASIVPAVSGLGSGAVISVQTRQNTYGTNPVAYFNQHTGVTDNVLIQDQLDQVKSYFTKLGYAIDILVNPTTTNTIMWKVAF